MKNKKSIYGDKPEIKKEDISAENIATDKFSEISYSMDINDAIIYMIGEIGEYSFYDFATRCRTILRERPEQKSGEPITLVMNSSGGCMFEMFGIIDYIKSRLLEDTGDLQRASYYRNKYERTIKQYPHRKSGVRSLSVPRL